MIKDLGSLQPTDRILLDANTCLFIFGPTKYRYEDPTRAMKYDNSQNNWGDGNVYICLLILSEFINKCRDYFWEIWKQDEAPYKKGKKHFRDSEYYRNMNIGDRIAPYVEEMLIAVECCDSDFDKTKAYAFLGEFKKGELDFNDVVIEEICTKNRLALVTDDGDFKNSNIDIFTAN